MCGDIYNRSVWPAENMDARGWGEEEEEEDDGGKMMGIGDR